MKNYLKITLILILAIILVGCSKKAKEIRPTQIFSQKEGTYYVYFYKENCSACENLQPRLNEYIQYSHSKQGKNAPKVYKVNVLSMPNLDASRKLARRNYWGNKCYEYYYWDYSNFVTD